jgi:hypothetical protein
MANDARYIKTKGLISNIFAIERKEERQNISKWDDKGNKMMLWHGTKAENIIGILQSGFRIAPDESFRTGSILGNGVYFADTFGKSLNYTQSYWSGKYKTNHPKLYLFLCEVALGKMKEITDIYSVEEKHFANIPGKQFQSVKGVGQKGPDLAKSIYLPSGCVVPLGPVVEYKYDKKSQEKVHLGTNEYVVYDTSQIRIKYVVEIKDTRFNN